MMQWITSVLVALGLVTGVSLSVGEQEQAKADAAAAACYAAMLDGEQQPTPQPKLKLRALVFGSPLCAPCRALEADIRKELPSKGWRIGPAETDHIEFVDATAARDRAAKYRIDATPTTVVIDERGDQQAKLVGGGSAALLADWLVSKGLRP